MSDTATTGDVRAAVENLLGTYAQLCDDHDVSGLAALLSEATVTFGHAEPISGARAVTDLFDAAFTPGLRTRHLITNTVITQTASHVATSRVQYTRWVLDPAPTLVGMGEYRSEFIAEGGHWQFAAHTVRRDWFQE